MLTRSIVPALLAVRTAYGCALLARPRVVGVALGAALDRPTLVVARVLGVRQILEALVLARHRSPRWLAAGAAVDALHAATALGLAAASLRHRRVALVNAATAGLLGAASVLAASGRRDAALRPSRAR